VRSVTGSREHRTAQEAKKPLQRCKASQTSRERLQCCGLLEALDGSRGYKVSGKCKMAVAGEITVYTDHQNCSNFATTKVSTRRQARWSEHLAEFDFKVIYRPGEKNTKKDVLSRRWDNALKEGSEASPVSFSRPFPAQFPESKRTRRETSSKAQRLRQTRLPSQRTG
jgi:hypothetical protein